MKLKREEVEHLAKLCRLTLSGKEVEKFQSQLSDILEYVEMLNEIDTERVEPTAQVTGLMNISEEDKVRSVKDPDALLRPTPLPLKNRQIKVKSVF